RFDNIPITKNGTLHWDIDMLFEEVKKTLQKVAAKTDISSIAVDTWGVDFALLDESGTFKRAKSTPHVSTWGVDFALLDESGTFISGPVHYRDKRTNHMAEEVNRYIPLEQL